MRSNIKMWLAATLMFVTGAASASAQRTADPDFFASSYWTITAVETTAVEPISHTVGELLFHQNFTSPIVARVTSDASVSVPGVTRWNRSPAQVMLNSGMPLFKLVNVGGSTIFCSGQSSYRASNVWDNRNWRLCLYDREADGVFDRVMWMPITDTNNFGGMFLLRDGRAEGVVSIPYAVETNSNLTVLVGGPVITRSPLGAYRVTLGLCHEGEPVVFHVSAPHESRATNQAEPIDAGSAWFFQQDLPITVDLDGARITITAIREDQATYEILSPFDSSATLALWYNHQIPAPCEHVG